LSGITSLEAIGIEEEIMGNRREFIKTVASATAGMLITGRGLMDAGAQAAQGRGGRGGQGQPAADSGPVVRREVRVGGKKVKVIDVHAHATFPEVADVVKGTALARNAQGGGRALGQDRINELDKRGIDIQVLDINAFWWYAADRDLATKIVYVHDKGLAAWVNAHHDRFAALTSPALQFPDLAAQQLEHAVKDLGMVGAAIAGHVDGQPLSDAKFDPFWAKAQELDVMVFMHPGGADNVIKEDGLKGRGDLGNIVGNPLETTVFLSHLIYDGTFDRFPNLKICGAHAGGYMPSYLGRTEVACDVRANAGCLNKKKPSEYLKRQVFVDSMVFSPEAVRHLVAEMGPSQVVYGTDIPLVWPDTVDSILGAQMPDADKEAVLGGNLIKLLRLKT
jgi:aminocarboxymuconate-semialdehyde decarboxylase